MALLVVPLCTAQRSVFFGILSQSTGGSSISTTPANTPVVGAHNTAPTYTLTAGNLAILGFSNDGGGTTVTSITGCSSTWAKAVSGIQSGLGAEIWYAMNVAGGSCTPTINITGGTNYFAVLFDVAGASTTAALDGFHNDSGGTTVTVTSTFSNEFFFVVMSSNVGTLCSSGFSTAMSTLFNQYALAQYKASSAGSSSGTSCGGGFGLVGATFK